MLHTLRYLFKVTSLGIQRFVVNRKNLAVVVLFEVLDAISSIVHIEVLYGNFESVAGYSKYELYFLYGITLCQLKIMMLFFIGGIDSFSNKIISRDVDLVLLRPMNPHTLMMVPETNIHQLLSMIPAVYMVVYGLVHCKFAVGMNILFSAISFICGIILTMNIFSILMPIAFWTISATSLNDFVFTIQSNSNYPKDVYPKAIRFLLIFVFPVVLFSNPSAMCIFEKEYWLNYLILDFIYVFVTSVVKRIVWKVGIRRYQCSMQ